MKKNLIHTQHSYTLQPRHDCHISHLYFWGVLFSLIGAWIITGGTRTGVMEFVGDAVKDHIITTGRKNDVVVLGMATWGCVANRQALDGEEVGKLEQPVTFKYHEGDKKCLQPQKLKIMR